MKLAIKTLLALTACAGIAACDVDQTKEGELPDVDVNATGGNLPAFDVDTADVNIGTENRVVEVPTVDVDGPKEDNAE